MTQSSAVETFEFIGFEPNQNVATRAMEKLTRVFGESPSDSSTSASLSKNAAGIFQGRLRVRSAVGEFVADVIGEDPIQVLNTLSRKVRSQLRMWKRRRFLELDGL